MRLSALLSFFAAFFLLLTPAQADDLDKTGWPRSLAIGTASQGGTYFIYGSGMAGLLSEKIGVNSAAEVTGGPVQNVTSVQMKDYDIGFVTLGPASEAWNGKSRLAPGNKHHDIRALFPMYQTPFEIVALQSSGIKSVSDLQGKRVSVAPAGGTAGTYWPRIFKELGVKARTSHSGANDAVGQVKDGLIDAFAFAAGVPIAAFSQIAAENDVNIFSLTEEEQAKILKAMPEMAAFTIPGDTYKGFPEPRQTVAMWNFVIVHKDMPDSLAYAITKTVLENNPHMVQVHATALETLAKNAPKNTVVPFHPGALRYYKEIGIEIPEISAN